MNIYNQSGVNMEKTQTTVAEERVSSTNDNTVVWKQKHLISTLTTEILQWNITPWDKLTKQAVRRRDKTSKYQFKNRLVFFVEWKSGDARGFYFYLCNKIIFFAVQGRAIKAWPSLLHSQCTPAKTGPSWNRLERKGTPEILMGSS